MKKDGYAIALLASALWLFALGAVFPFEERLLLAVQGAVGCFVIFAASYDWYTLRLPHLFTLPAAFIAICGVGFTGAGWSVALLGSSAGFFTLKTVQLLTRWRHGRDGIGSGDALLMLSLGALVGLEGLPWGLILAAVSGFCGTRILQKEKIPFGPFLVVGCLTVLLFN